MQKEEFCFRSCFGVTVVLCLGLYRVLHERVEHKYSQDQGQYRFQGFGEEKPIYKKKKNFLLGETKNTSKGFSKSSP